MPPSSLYILEDDGTINFTQPINLSNTTNLSKVMAVSFNYTFVNSTDPAGQQLNRSAILEFYSLPFAGAQAVVDPEDDNIWDICLPPRCNNPSYNTSSKIFRMNVSSFTAYATAELSECGDLDLRLGETQSTYTLINNVSATGTCFNIINDNITLDCRGYAIYYDTSNYNNVHGINSTDNRNIIIQNCTIIQDSTTGQNAHAINIINSTKNTIINTIITTKATGSAAINLNNTQQTGINNTQINASGSALRITNSENTTINCQNNTAKYASTGTSNGIHTLNSTNTLITQCPLAQSGTGNTNAIYLENTTNLQYINGNITTKGTLSNAIKTNNSQNININTNTIQANTSILKTHNTQNLTLNCNNQPATYSTSTNTVPALSLIHI